MWCHIRVILVPTRWQQEDWEVWVVFGYTGGLKGPHQILSHKNTKGGSVFILPAGVPFLGANSETMVTLLGPLGEVARGQVNTLWMS